MRTAVLFLTGAALLSLACAPSPAERPEAVDVAAVTAEIDSVVASLYEAMNAHDPERVMAHYLPTDDFLYVGVSESLLGWETVSQVLAPWYRAHPDVTFEYQVVHIQVLGPDAATVTVRGGSSESPHLMWTRTLVRHEGEWRIALEHESWPGGAAPGSKHPGT